MSPLKRRFLRTDTSTDAFAPTIRGSIGLTCTSIKGFTLRGPPIWAKLFNGVHDQTNKRVSTKKIKFAPFGLSTRARKNKWPTRQGRRTRPKPKNERGAQELRKCKGRQSFRHFFVAILPPHLVGDPFLSTVIYPHGFVPHKILPAGEELNEL